MPRPLFLRKASKELGHGPGLLSCSPDTEIDYGSPGSWIDPIEEPNPGREFSDRFPDSVYLASQHTVDLHEVVSKVWKIIARRGLGGCNTEVEVDVRVYSQEEVLENEGPPHFRRPESEVPTPTWLIPTAELIQGVEVTGGERSGQCLHPRAVLE